MSKENLDNNPRIIVIQKLYGYYLNKNSNILGAVNGVEESLIIIL